MTNEYYTFECYRNAKDPEIMSCRADRDTFLRRWGSISSLTMAFGFKEAERKGHHI